MKTPSAINYRELFKNNPVYHDPKSILTREEFWIFVLWVNGIDNPSISTLLKIPLGTVKLRLTGIFDRLRLKLGLNFGIDNRALIEACRDYGILTEENHKLPKEVMQWVIKNKPPKKTALRAVH